MDQASARQVLRDLLSSQRLAVLATQDQGQPYTSLVAFVAADDLQGLIFATARHTRKYMNMTANSRVAMLVDDRSADDVDFSGAVAVTATGNACEVPGDEHVRLAELVLGRHPHLKAFLDGPDCALMHVAVERYYVVSSFQEITELRVR
jgi:heme iron utilization protein